MQDVKETAYLHAGIKALLEAIASTASVVKEAIVDVVLTVPGVSVREFTGRLVGLRGIVRGK
jgi:hypothetical protein